MDPLLVVIIAMGCALFVATVYMEWLGWLSLMTFLERHGPSTRRQGQAARPSERTSLHR
jgi:hypothetical protein